MRELELARERIRHNPEGHAERVLLAVIVALESGGNIDLGELYTLDYDTFRLALALMDGWWLQRHVGVARNGVLAASVDIERRVIPA